MNWLQIRLFGPYLSSFSTNSYGYYSLMSQNLFSNSQIFASALIARQAARKYGKTLTCRLSQIKSPSGKVHKELPEVSHWGIVRR
jgi:hypothetical protein